MPEVWYSLMSCAVRVFPRLKFLKRLTDVIWPGVPEHRLEDIVHCVVWDVWAWNGLNWLRIGTSDGILGARR